MVRVKSDRMGVKYLLLMVLLSVMIVNVYAAFNNSGVYMPEDKLDRMKDGSDPEIFTTFKSGSGGLSYRDIDPEILALLKNSGGKLSPEVRSVFLKKAKKSVLDSLLKLGKSVDQSMLSWVDSDSVVYDAIYGSVSPVDPEILLNLDQFWLELGAEYTKKYKNLTLSAAIARRGMGIDSIPGFGRKWGVAYTFLEEAQKAGKSFTQYLIDKDANAEMPNMPKSSEDTIAYSKVKEFLNAENLTYRKAWDDTITRAKVGSILNTSGSNVNVFNCLLGLLVINSDQYPEKRSWCPSVSNFIKFMINNLEKPASSLPLTDKQTWPIFPTLSAPWPLLMPLAKTIPLDECNFIWEKYLGKHGDNRLHAYGPYRSNTKPYQLIDRSWNLNSYPARIEVGGVCGTMATISTEVHTPLGKPVFKSGQPGHGNVVRYDAISDGKFIAQIGQSVAGVKVTTTFWFFRDGNAWDLQKMGTYAIHHFGLALSATLGLRQYMDTRIALHIYRTLSEEQKDSLGNTLLLSTLMENPSNTEVLYTLAKDTKHAASILAIMDTLPASLKDNTLLQDAKMKKNVNTYVDQIMKKMLNEVFTNPMNFPSEDQIILTNFLESLKDKYPLEVANASKFFKRRYIPWQQVRIKSAPDDISKVSAIIDNDINSRWLLWKDHPVEIVFEVDTSYDISGFLYYTRSDGVNYGQIKNYLIFVSDDGVNWGDTIVSSEWKNSKDSQCAFFDSVKGKYLKYVALNAYGNHKATGIREIKILYTPSNTTAISSKSGLHNAIPVISSVRTARSVQFRLNSSATESGLCKIYNIQGKMVRTILPVKSGGRVSYTVNRTGLAQQIYIVKIKLKNSTFIQKLLF